jgi:hypothetical protein
MATTGRHFCGNLRGRRVRAAASKAFPAPGKHPNPFDARNPRRLVLRAARSLIPGGRRRCERRPPSRSASSRERKEVGPPCPPRRSHRLPPAEIRSARRIRSALVMTCREREGWSWPQKSVAAPSAHAQAPPAGDLQRTARPHGADDAGAGTLPRCVWPVAALPARGLERCRRTSCPGNEGPSVAP